MVAAVFVLSCRREFGALCDRAGLGGKVFERTRSGQELDWGSVGAWEQPRRLEFTWQPGTTPDVNQTMTVDFRPERDGTRVTLTRRGWHCAPLAACSSRFAQFVSEQMLVAA